VWLELEESELNVAVAAVASDDSAPALVPEVAPLVSRSGETRLGFSLLAGAALPSAARTADGRFAWHANSADVLLAQTAPIAGEGSGHCQDFATSLPLRLASAKRHAEPTEMSLDGLPVVGQLDRSPLAVACGFSGLAPGFAFAAARWVADALLRGTDPTPDALRPKRAPLALPDV
jgi:hypothetical protein